jgi:hypothetical protein
LKMAGLPNERLFLGRRRSSRPAVEFTGREKHRFRLFLSLIK